jgi:hypothetical protein
MAGLVEHARGLDRLVRDLARDLENEVEDEEGDVWVKSGRGRRGALGGAEEGEEIAEEGGPLVDVGAEEEEGESVGEFVA